MPAEKLRNAGVAVERRDAPLWLIAILAFGLSVFCVVSVIALRFVYPDALRGPSDAPSVQTAKPRLEINSSADLAAYRAAQHRALTGYGWIDRPHGIVHIPIAQAMQDIARAGIKDWPGDAR